jgi:hypothetical protein
MATGETTTGTLADSLPVIKASARIVREFEGTWMRTTDRHDLASGTGLNWEEVTLDQLAAQDITETTNNQNAQQIVDSLLQVEPTMTQILLKITDRTYRKIAAVVKSKFGSLAGNAMARKKDEDYLALFSTFSTAVQPGTGVSFAYGYIASAKNRISSNATEGAVGSISTILHGHVIKDIQDVLVSGIGTYNIPVGLTEEVFRRGFAGSVTGSNVYEDGNLDITINTNDARGATHAREGVVAIMGMSIKTEMRRDPAFGGGADEIFMTDEYAFAERTSVWAYAHLSDATPPTS